MPTYGLTPQGFISKSHQELRAEARALAQQLLGNQTLDLSSTSVLSQILDIYTNGLADCWAAAADLYASAYPNGAQGLQVDQLLAVNNLMRLQPVATRTDPTPLFDAGGNPAYGFVAYGTPGAILPAGALLSPGSGSLIRFSVDADIAIAPAQSARQAVLFTNSPTSGAYVLQLTAADGTVYNSPSITYAARPAGTLLIFTPPTTSVASNAFWTVQVDKDSEQSFNIPYGADAVALQNALQSCPAYTDAKVSGDTASGWLITWGKKEGSLVFTGSLAPSPVVGVQDILRGITAADGSLPFADLAVSDGGQALVLQYGAIALTGGAKGTGAQPIPLVTIASSTLARGSAATGLSCRHLVFGAPAQGVGSATCTQAGATEVAAGQLNTLVNPYSGVSGCTNPLDCVAGRGIESDTDAIARLQSQQTAAATGSLGAVVARVQEAAGVTQAVGFQNSTSAAQQLLLFGDAPSQGSFSLALAGGATPLLPYNAAAADVQAALRQIAGLDDVTVTGAGQAGYQLSFGPISGLLPHALATVPSNTTGVSLAAYVGCPSHAIEVVVEGGTPADVASAILSALPAGVGTYGRASARLPGSTTLGSASVAMVATAGAEAGQLVTAVELPDAAVVQTVSASGIVLNRSANATNANSLLAFGYGATLLDQAGNAVTVRFSRPKPVLIYVDLTIQTDESLGAASQFNQASVASIQSILLATVNAVPIGGTVVTTGTKGLLNSFRSIPGIVSSSIAIGRDPLPGSDAPLPMAANETPVAESASVNITVT